jgi:hypothetical protein
MSNDASNAAPNADPETPPALPPAVPNAAPELAALKDELAALRAEIAELTKATAEAPANPVVPGTDTPPPAITPKAPDTSALPVYARLAAGYSK